MPLLQFFTTIPAGKVPKDFVQKTAVLLTQILKGKPLERISVHLVTDQNIFAGNDPSGNEDKAYAVLRSIGCVTADDNRKTIEVMSKHVNQELGVTTDQFKMFFIDLDPNMTATNGSVDPDQYGSANYEMQVA